MTVGGLALSSVEHFVVAPIPVNGLNTPVARKEKRSSNQERRRPCADFFVITPPRSGSTWLFDNLRCHPAIYLNPEKELKYFSNLLDSCDFEWYEEQFAEAGGRVTGDISPSYAILPDDVISAVKRRFPDLRIVAVFRDPLERAWSHVKHQFRLREASFANFEFESFASVPRSLLIKALLGFSISAYSDYLAILKCWRRHFPKESFFVGFFEGVEQDPAQLLADIFQHVGVAVPTDYSNYSIKQISNKGLDAEIPADLRQILISAYAKRTKEFRAFVQEEFGVPLPSAWNYIVDSEADPPRDIQFDLDGQILKDVLIREMTDSSHIQLLLRDYRGFRILGFRKQCVGISWDADVDLAALSASSLEELKRQGKAFSAGTLDDTKAAIDDWVDCREGIGAPLSRRRFDSLLSVIGLQAEENKRAANRIIELDGYLSQTRSDAGKRIGDLEAQLATNGRMDRDRIRELESALLEQTSGASKRIRELERYLESERAMQSARISDLESLLDAERIRFHQRITELESAREDERSTQASRITELERTSVIERDRASERIRELESALAIERSSLIAKIRELEESLTVEREHAIGRTRELESAFALALRNFAGIGELQKSFEGELESMELRQDQLGKLLSGHLEILDARISDLEKKLVEQTNVIVKLNELERMSFLSRLFSSSKEASM